MYREFFERDFLPVNNKKIMLKKESLQSLIYTY